MKKILINKTKTVSRTTLKKLLKDENTVVYCRQRLTDDYYYDACTEFGEGEVNKEEFLNRMMPCLSHIKQPRFYKVYDRPEIDVLIGTSGYYTIKNENIEWIV